MGKKTENDEWNFTEFYKYPFITNNRNEYISISDVTLINGFFEKIFWLIRECYDKKNNTAMDFFGRLFERYIQDITKDACGSNFVYIDEFIHKVNKNMWKSSDAYIKRNENLLVIEAKGVSVYIDCMAKNEKVENNNHKLFINPILQADKFLSEIIDKKDDFKCIKSIFIISVSLDNINAVPNYYNTIHEKIEKNKKCKLVQYYFNLNIEEYEMLLYLIEQNKDIFGLLQEYFINKELIPFSNFIYKKEKNIRMTKFMEKIYSEAKNNMFRALYK